MKGCININLSDWRQRFRIYKENKKMTPENHVSHEKQPLASLLKYNSLQVPVYFDSRV